MSIRLPIARPANFSDMDFLFFLSFTEPMRLVITMSNTTSTDNCICYYQIVVTGQLGVNHSV